MTRSPAGAQAGAEGDHFAFTEEHRALREVIRTFARRELAPHAADWEREPFPNSVFKRLGELGLLGLAYPEQYGGQGGDYLSNIVLAEEMSHASSPGLALAVAVQTDMATPLVYALGSDTQKLAYLTPAIRGDAVACLGITEPNAGSDMAAIRTRATKDGSTYRITGSKMYVTNGIRADYIVLLAKTDPDAGHAGFTIFLVDMALPGVTRDRALEKLGMHASDTALLSFDDVRVPAAAVLGEVGHGFYDIMWQLQGERLVSTAGALSHAQRAFQRALEYARSRTAFGRRIADFQVLAHMFVDMSTELEVARQLVYTAAWRYANGEYPVRDICTAKVYGSRVAVSVADRCIQICGGAGYTKELGFERVWRDLRLNRIGAGTDEIMYDTIGRALIS